MALFRKIGEDLVSNVLRRAVREYDNYTLIKKGDKLADIPVWYGTDKTVPLVASEDIIRTLKKSVYNQAKIKIAYDRPVKAPIEMGQQLGVLKIELPDNQQEEVPLYAGQTINKIGLAAKIMANICSNTCVTNILW